MSRKVITKDQKELLQEIEQLHQWNDWMQDQLSHYKSQLETIQNSGSYKILEKVWDLKSRRHKSRFVVEKIIKEGKTVTYQYQVTGNLKKYFYLECPFSITYEENIEKVPDSILIIPLITNVLPIVWVFNAELIVEEVDRTFYECLEEIKEGYKKMIPEMTFKGKITVGRLREYEPLVKDKDKALVFFSGGVDSYSTFVDILKGKPDLLTVWGADIDYNNEEGWKFVRDYTKQVAKENKLKNVHVHSKMKKFIDYWYLDIFVKQTLHDPADNWWRALHHGIGLLGHAAPYAYLHGITKIYMPATYNNTDKRFICASAPMIDDHFRFGNVTTFHQGFDKTRMQKVENICNYVKESKKKAQLRVCWRSADGDNCSHCEKCYRTIIALATEGMDPADFGFEMHEHIYDEIKDFILKQDFQDLYYRFWIDIRNNIIKNHLEKDKRFAWLLTWDKIKDRVR